MRHTALGLLALVLPIQAGAADVVINEVMFDPDGADGGSEWVELYNTSSDDIDLTGWSIERAKSSWGERITFDGGTLIPAGGHLLVGDVNVPDTDVVVTGGLDLGNSADGVRLIGGDGTTVEDVVLYGGGALTDYTIDFDIADADGTPTSAAPDAPSGTTVARSPDGTDTGDQAVDFIIGDPPTPGGANPRPPLCVADAGTLVINEFLPDPDGTDGTVLLEYVELYNSGSELAELSGWSLERASRRDSDTGDENWSSIFVFEEGDQVGPEGFTVLGEQNVTGADITSGSALGLYSGSGGDGLRLIDCEGSIVDVVLYGGSNEDGLRDEGDVQVSEVAPTPPSGAALGRVPDGTDTNVSADDWEVVLANSPGGSNPVCEVADGSLLMSEVLVNPDGTDSEVGLEYVELYNNGSNPITLLGWALQDATSGDTWGNVHVFGSGTTALASSYFLVGEPNVSGADVTVESLGLGGGTDGDGLRLVDCAGNVADALVYGSNNDDGVFDESGAPATSLAPRPGSGEALARRFVDVDTDLSGDDWWIPGQSTPGAENPASPVCVPAGSDAPVINELLPNPTGADSTALAEYIELYSGSSSEVSLDDWSIEVATAGGAWRSLYVWPAESRIGAGAFWVLGEPNATGADVVLPRINLGSGADGDGVRLVDCEGTVVDSVVYGDNNDDAVEDDSGAAAVSLAPTPGDGGVLARFVDGQDTDASADDFWVAPESTVGSANPEPPTCVPTAGGLVLNEVLVNPDGSDTTAEAEYIELFNSTDSEIDLEGWGLSFASAADEYTLVHTFSRGAVVAPGGWLVVGEANVEGADVTVGRLALGNGGDGDGIRLVDCEGTAVDTLVYGSDNADGVVDDSGAAALSPAPKPGDGEVLARRVDGLDTDDHDSDWFIPGSATPGADNPEPPLCVPGTPGDLLLTEFLPDPVGADGTVLLEFVELYNPGGALLELSGWRVQFASSGSSWRDKVVFTEANTVDAGDWYLVGEPNVTGADVTVDELGLGGGTGGDGLRVVDCEGNVIDGLVYGDSNDDAIEVVGGVVDTTVGADPGSGETVARRDDDVDTDDHGEDWYVPSVATPGDDNPVPPVCVAGDSSVLINEFVPNPTGSDADALGEWIELVNTGTEAVDVSNWVIEYAAAVDAWDVVATVPEPAIIEPGDYLVIGEALSGADALVEQMSLGNGFGGDGLRLVDCKQTVQDTVLYGAVNDDGIADDTGTVPALSAPLPSDGQSLARRVDGVDTDDSNADFGVAGIPSQGEANPELLCIPADGTVVLNELFADPEGDDSTAKAEWVEIFNAGDGEASLDGWGLIFAGRPDDLGIDFSFPGGSSVASGDWFVVADELAPVADITTSLNIGNGNGGDAVILVDCTGAVADVLVYGGENDDGHLDENGLAAEAAPQPAAGFSLARELDGVDSDLAGDWLLARTPTPGAANATDEEPGDDTGDDTATDTGEEEGESCGCATSSPGGSGAWLMLVGLLALRRRR